MAMRLSTSRALNTTDSKTAKWSFCVVILLGLWTLIGVGCDDAGAPPPPPPPAQAAPSPPAAPPPAEAVKPTPEPEAVVAPEAQRVLPPKSSPTADKDTRRALVLEHYKTMRCLVAEGATTVALSAAFQGSGLTPQVWNQALGELLQAMEADPDGDVARIVRAPDSEVCSGRGAP